MKPQHVAQAASSSRNICLFCIHRLRNRETIAIPRNPRRSFVKAAGKNQQAAVASAGASLPDGEASQARRLSRSQRSQRGSGDRSRFQDENDSGAHHANRNGHPESGQTTGKDHQRTRGQQPAPLLRFTEGDSTFNYRKDEALQRYLEDKGKRGISAVQYKMQDSERFSPSQHISKMPAFDPQPRRVNAPQQAFEERTFEPPDWRRERYKAPQVASFDDAAPQRRRRGDKPNRVDRREEKFDLSGEGYPEEDFDAKAKKEAKKQRRKEKAAVPKEAQDKTILLPAFISVVNLAMALHVRVESFVQKLEDLGFEGVANDHVLTYEDASLVAMEYNYQAVADRGDSDDLKPRPPPEDMSVLPQRPPVVTIMGHVDHGKTTLLDFLRKSSVAAQEHGGITQHIGAFSVPMASGNLITFLDTPGHAAFLSMRERGANVTDIVILVVAADDSVKPQTIEAIKHAKAAKVPIIVAINKVDKDEADIEKVKQDLLRHEIEVEDFGGDVQAYPVSGKTGEGLEDLVEAMVTQAEILDMRAETDGPAEGWVLEATTKKAGRIATVLVRRGTLRPGNVIVAGTTWARVRSLRNEAGVEIREAPPGTPVEVDGWRDQPLAGDEVLEAESEQIAADVVHYRNFRVDQVQAAVDMEAINEHRRLGASKREREKAERKAAARGDSESVDATPSAEVEATVTETELYFIVKADVSGSAEAIEGSLVALPLSKHPVRLNVLRTGVGPVSEFDIDHASAVRAGNGFIISFNQQVPPHVSVLAQRAGVKILDENIIYKVIDEVRGVIETKLPPVITKRVVGEAEAAQVFEINTGGRRHIKVAGCKVRNGVISKNGKVRVYRGDVGDDASLVYDGTINTLKSHKKDVQEMRKGNECGLGFKDWEDFKQGDILQCYEEMSEPRRLN